MGARTQAREAALQMLFAVEAGGTEVERAIADFWAELPAEDAEGRPYATIENVWRIISQAHEAGFILTVEEGRIVHISPTNASLPA